MTSRDLSHLRETLAIDSWEVDSTNIYATWDELPDYCKAQYLANADAILDIIDDEGWELTPKQPVPPKDEREELRADYYDDIAKECNGY